MKGRPRPVLDLLHQAMFQRIVMDMIRKAFRVVFFTARLFIVSTLPHSVFVFDVSAAR